MANEAKAEIEQKNNKLQMHLDNATAEIKDNKQNSIKTQDYPPKTSGECWVQAKSKQQEMLPIFFLH
ncbi:hypothetical protein TVAG_000630 [Trichomonas vaginalis G3]|uniref:Uncharacterized protein n=1 Tax=Trichomonas vaginalis (strain ATCC PRA-98 / G3) TaxID=412133 RepID=A2EHT9_TRIV3|nr:hypothetical protein TVAGG3_0076990 [Trichomonas vaginalis G3]EAY07779.1 hypothetical protein TVAG_000630 [Trichomonas vaginalis G3]KAI5542946.1 hypothetical protein TVAGG3_0076990 [Trichomonas vaginalis G3]|eukprot:XP_001320002.1 hypothetical protein [Trichomonas vaginalis G3]